MPMQIEQIMVNEETYKDKGVIVPKMLLHRYVREGQV